MNMSYSWQTSNMPTFLITRMINHGAPCLDPMCFAVLKQTTNSTDFEGMDI